MRPSIETQWPDVRVFAHLTTEFCTLYIDTSGEPLFKRGWRQDKGDAPLTISQSLTYKGTAIIMVSGQITITGNSQTICAQNTSCNFGSWQGSSGNNDMLTLATVLKNSSAAFNFVGQNETFMGSMWTQTSSQINFVGNTYVIMGPLSTGSLAINKNGFTFRPLPVITNMPLGAPVPPNVSVTINPMKVIG